jgi:predicted dehydrogenase
MEQVRIAVLGTGIIIRDFHLPILRECSRAKVVAAGNLHAPSLQTLAEQFAIPKTYTDFDLLAHDPEIDAVIIGLPNYLHASITVQMLRAGKHVLCEKPMAMTAAEAQGMIDASDGAQRKLMIGHMWRFDREVCWLRNVIDSGILGAIFKIKAQAVWIGDGPPVNGWFVQPGLAGGGAMADMGIHSIDIISFLFHDRLRPVRVYAQMGTYCLPIQVEDTANVTVEYDNDMTAVIEAGWNHNYADGPEGSVQVFGTEGYARTFPTELHCRIGGTWGQYRPTMPPRRQQCDLPMYALQMEHFLDCILKDQNPVPGGQQGLRAMALLDAAYRSAQQGASVSM